MPQEIIMYTFVTSASTLLQRPMHPMRNFSGGVASTRWVPPEIITAGPFHGRPKTTRTTPSALRMGPDIEGGGDTAASAASAVYDAYAASAAPAVYDASAASAASTAYDASAASAVYDASAASAVYDAAAGAEIQGTEDIVGGVVLALALALLGSRNAVVASFLQGRTTRASSDDYLLLQDRPDPPDRAGGVSVAASSSAWNATNGTSVEEGLPVGGDTVGVEKKTFGADSWKEMSKKENFVYYNTRIKRRLQSLSSPSFSSDEKKKPSEASISTGNTVKTEKKWIIFGLLLLFVPVFSFEFFLALSRQFMCSGDPFAQAEWARELCSPYPPQV